MRQILIAYAFLSILVGGAAAQTPASPYPESDSALVDSVHKWLTAQAALDRKAMEQLIDPKFIGTAFGDTVLTRNDILPEPGQDPGRWNKAPSRSRQQSASLVTPAL